MSTRSTATSARRLSHDAAADDAVAGRELETRLRDLKRDWRAYKSSRSAAGSSGEDPSDFLRCSPRRLVYSPDSGAGSSAGTVVPVKRDSGGRRRHGSSEEEDASGVGSVEVKDSHSASSTSSCSCPRHRAALRRSCSTSFSRSVATELSPPAARSAGVVDTEEPASKTEGERGVTGNNGGIKRLAAVALVAVVVVGFVVAVMMAGVELGVDEEFLVPT